MKPEDVLNNFVNQPEDETVEALKMVIWRAYGEVTNGRYVDRLIRTKQILEDALEEYGHPDYDGDDPYGARND